MTPKVDHEEDPDLFIPVLSLTQMVTSLFLRVASW